MAVLPAGQVPRHAPQDEGVAHPVADRVEEGAAGGACRRRFGHGAVEQVEGAGQDQKEEARDQPSGGDRQAGAHRHHQAGGGDVISGDAEMAEGRADGPETSLNAVAKAPVEQKGLLVRGGPLQATHLQTAGYPRGGRSVRCRATPDTAARTRHRL